VRTFVDRTGIPFVVTPKAKGILPEDAPGFLGVISGMAMDRAVMETVDQADVLLGVGFDPVECDKTWYVGRRIANLALAATAETNYRPLEHLGPIGDNLARLGERAGRVVWPAEVLAAARERMRPAVGMGAQGALSPSGVWSRRGNPGSSLCPWISTSTVPTADQYWARIYTSRLPCGAFGL